MASSPTMRAMVSNASGGYCLNSTMPQPTPEPGMMLVRVEAVALNPYDTKVIEYGLITPDPYIGGCDFAGVVVRIGPGVTRFQPGDKVLSMHTRGGFAEFALAVENLSCHIPKDMSLNEACSLGLGIGIAGLALFQQPGLNLPLRNGQTDRGEINGNGHANGYTNGHTNGSTNGHKEEEEAKPPVTVLVAGGASASGTMATQLLKVAGYNPIVTCSPANNALCESYGASACFDYNSSTCGADIRLHTDNSLAHVLDCVTNVATMTMCYEAIGTQGGTYIALDATANTVKYTRRDIRADWVMANTLLGEPCKLDGVYGRPSTPEHREFASQFFKLAEQWLGEGKIRNHPLEIRTGGLESVDPGLQDLRDGVVRGKKLVVPLAVGA
ncbi:alcohol dehydrogenase GroES-like domain-containing protein [Fusarium austroafricanum]|uniref:Alcohol dehydrogenase GroES-like domain-containing protein n=1 Tax=Fusarium austroafricanum TaxID=2364996 RepID=A0A8H4K0W7_9HYPO|nr:alcohol dehydrogenase GroES-like domain-containing protein [Fusarium austroafricanum]